MSARWAFARKRNWENVAEWVGVDRSSTEQIGQRHGHEKAGGVQESDGRRHERQFGHGHGHGHENREWAQEWEWTRVRAKIGHGHGHGHENREWAQEWEWTRV